MGGRRALLGRGTEANDRLAGDQRRPWIGFRFAQRLADIVKIMTIAGNNVPARGPIARRNIFTRR